MMLSKGFVHNFGHYDAGHYDGVLSVNIFPIFLSGASEIATHEGHL